MQGKNVIDCATTAPILTFFPVNIRLYITIFLYPVTQKVALYYVIPSEPFEYPLKESYVFISITEPLQIKHDVAFCQFYYCLSVSGDRPNAKVEMLFSMSWLPYH